VSAAIQSCCLASDAQLDAVVVRRHAEIGPVLEEQRQLGRLFIGIGRREVQDLRRWTACGDDLIVSEVATGLLRRDPFAVRDSCTVGRHQRGAGNEGALALQSIPRSDLAALRQIGRLCVVRDGRSLVVHQHHFEGGSVAFRRLVSRGAERHAEDDDAVDQRGQKARGQHTVVRRRQPGFE
jgi:hypothetical protein